MITDYNRQQKESDQRCADTGEFFELGNSFGRGDKVSEKVFFLNKGDKFWQGIQGQVLALHIPFTPHVGRGPGPLIWAQGQKKPDPVGPAKVCYP